MVSNDKMVGVYMDVATSMASLSHGKRGKVGACVVTKNGVLLVGVNGLPQPLGNQLEYDVAPEDAIFHDWKTKPEVIHAEENCILKAAREGVSLIGATVFVTHSPCPHCASMLDSCGVSKVFYRHVHGNGEGLAVLEKCGVPAIKVRKDADGWGEDGE